MVVLLWEICLLLPPVFLVCCTDFSEFWKVQNKYCMVTNIFSPKESFIPLAFESEKSQSPVILYKSSFRKTISLKSMAYINLCILQEGPNHMKVSNLPPKSLIFYICSKLTGNDWYALCINLELYTEHNLDIIDWLNYSRVPYNQISSAQFYILNHISKMWF